MTMLFVPLVVVVAEEMWLLNLIVDVLILQKAFLLAGLASTQSPPNAASVVATAEVVGCWAGRVVVV